MRTSRLVPLVSLALACVTSLVSASAAAADEKLVAFGVGVVGVVGGNFLGRPDDNTIPLANGTRALTDTYPGFGGLTAGFGAMADLRLFHFTGVEADLYRSTDHGNGDLVVSGSTVTIDIGGGAWHLPILAKLVLPLRIVRPMVLFGGEFVFPSSPSATATPEPPAGSTTYGATAGTYAWWMAGLGVELKLPLRAVDLRIPFTIRGKVRSVSDSLEDRAQYEVSGRTITHIDYVSEWQWSAVATLGVALYF
jgi:hypothetical protein